MRCNNCGWVNPDGATKCVKCGQALSGGAGNGGAAASCGENLQSTVREGVVFPDDAGGNVGGNAAGVSCPRCGYVLRPGSVVCPNCGHNVNGQETNPEAGCRGAGAAGTGARSGAANGGGNAVGGTVNPWVVVAPQAKCSLTPVAQAGETETPRAWSLKGDRHELNRANLDEDNNTITSKLQAVLTCEDGQWFVEDRSQQKTTFVRSEGKMALKDGDVILMGNRQFVFKAE